MRRATLSTAFLTGTAIAIPLYLSPLFLSPWLLVRSATAMACLGYVALWAIFVIGPQTWVGWTFKPAGGTLEPLPRALAWLAGAGAVGAGLAAAELLPFK